MKKNRKLQRRKFLKTAAVAAVAGSTIACQRASNPWRFFSLEEARTLEAICERMIPTDQDPGAAGCGVVNFIDRQLVGFHKQHQQSYRDGIAGVDQAAMALHGKPFADLQARHQDALLAAMEKNQVPGAIWQRLPARQFFDLVISHTMQGYYGDPRHGGNRDALSWKMLGVALAPVRGRQRSKFNA